MTDESNALGRASERPALVYRPNKHDDWGFIRNSEGHLVAIVRSEIGLTESERAEHRKNKTDPCREMGLRIVKAVNDREADKVRIAELEAALERARPYVQFAQGGDTQAYVLHAIDAALSNKGRE